MDIMMTNLAHWGARKSIRPSTMDDVMRKASGRLGQRREWRIETRKRNDTHTHTHTTTTTTTIFTLWLLSFCSVTLLHTYHCICRRGCSLAYSPCISPCLYVSPLSVGWLVVWSVGWYNSQVVLVFVHLQHVR
jgi:hypothetical protein